ncbi:hypothetical protein TrRE_jg2318 [Triparma retinervis]|jgi:hypothetical protein|uniref:Uncharacterized protein n=1 Tax=Triparma retinervis TaxID=2557542 RepID=A0A9W7ASE4_9STRA|nr:hypothetical protein TrRE_jg2318 [Triparma retinervis]
MLNDELDAPLMSSVEADAVAFYDEDAVLTMSSHVASGYIILLTADKDMALPALLDGNVVDAAFGLSSHAVSASTATRRLISSTKNYVKKLTPDMQMKSVSCYEQLFKIVIKYHEAMNDAGLVRCCKEGEIRRVALVEMRRVFSAIDSHAGVPPPPSFDSQADEKDGEIN